MVVHIFNPSIRKADDVDLCEFKARAMGKANGLLPVGTALVRRYFLHSTL